jgi:anti-sigma regulatory factor (Ser/Thr protein kinase)
MIAAVADVSQVGEARRAAVTFAQRLGWGDGPVGRIALVATEMATNLMKHAGGGEIVIDTFSDDDGNGVQLLALDRGPGMIVQTCLQDGYSTAGSPGTGLGSIVRQADRFAAFSRPGQGSAVMARFSDGTREARSAGITIGTLVANYPGETVCGDGWAFGLARSGRTLLVADGSGHGTHAAAAATAAVGAFATHIELECVPLAERIHRALAPTRGAAIAVLRVDEGQQLIRFVGVGNIAAALISGGEMRRMVSHNGTAGHVAPRIREFTYPYSGAPLVVLHSDGISAKWEAATYPGLAANHPALIAGVVYRDCRRGRDDATVVAMRMGS